MSWVFAAALVVASAFIPVACQGEGALDFADSCKKQELNFKSTTDALQQRAGLAVAQFAVWSEHPDTIPEFVLSYYRDAVRSFAFNIWKETPDGKGTIASWQTTDLTVQKDKFDKFVYPQKVSQEQETIFARAVFQKDYADNLKPQIAKDMSELQKTIAEKRAELGDACKPDVFSQVMRATIGNAVLIVNGNFEASKNEKRRHREACSRSEWCEPD